VKNKRYMIVAVATMLLICLCYCQHVQRNHVDRPVGMRQQCDYNIRRIGLALQEYVHVNKDVPRDSLGNFSPDQLLCSNGSKLDHCLVVENACCSLCTGKQDLWKGLVLPNEFPQRYVQQLPGSMEDQEPFILCCHGSRHLHLGNHLNKDELRLSVCLSNGELRYYHCNKADFDEWVETKFTKGILDFPHELFREPE